MSFISGSHGEYEDDSLLGYSVLWSTRLHGAVSQKTAVSMRYFCFYTL
jgi:hypothetical protein